MLRRNPASRCSSSARRTACCAASGRTTWHRRGPELGKQRSRRRVAGHLKVTNPRGRRTRRARDPHLEATVRWISRCGCCRLVRGPPCGARVPGRRAGRSRALVGGQLDFSAKDPKEAYGPLVNTLIRLVSRTCGRRGNGSDRIDSVRTRARFPRSRAATARAAPRPRSLPGASHSTSRDREHHGRASQQPRDRHLRGVACSRPQPWRGALGAQRRPGTERIPRQEGQPLALAVVEHSLVLPVGGAIAVLHRDDRHDLPRTLDVGDRTSDRPTYRIFPSSCIRLNVPSWSASARRDRCGAADTGRRARPSADADCLPARRGGAPVARSSSLVGARPHEAALVAITSPAG